ncbi:hypothetical protein H920_00453 [Fukomys damarensis]|uniref:Uncharacterized protein n=1 Tax=Fukomys damarensis TaxID=885580 RepID=A0A091E5Q0_FUKDA|nr:hypothetical protein H920_00453 [Fukomys damarensis]
MLLLSATERKAGNDTPVSQSTACTGPGAVRFQTTSCGFALTLEVEDVTPLGPGSQSLCRHRLPGVGSQRLQ